MAGILTACAAWAPAELAPSSLAGEPREVRVTLMNGTRFPVSGPRMTSDSLWGTMVGPPYEPVALPLAWIRAIDLPRQDTNTAIALSVVGGVLALFVGLAVIVAVGGGL
jgi:hypothetical protein